MKRPTTKRYGVTDPVPDGYAYYNVFDRASELMPNFAVATFSAVMPNARQEAHALARRLNAKDGE